MIFTLVEALASLEKGLPWNGSATWGVQDKTRDAVCGMVDYFITVHIHSKVTLWGHTKQATKRNFDLSLFWLRPPVNQHCMFSFSLHFPPFHSKLIMYKVVIAALWNALIGVSGRLVQGSLGAQVCCLSGVPKLSPPKPR